MLAAIGVIIIAKQLPVALGEDNKGAPLVLLSKIPQFIREANPVIDHEYTRSPISLPISVQLRDGRVERVAVEGTELAVFRPRP